MLWPVTALSHYFDNIIKYKHNHSLKNDHAEYEEFHIIWRIHNLKWNTVMYFNNYHLTWCYYFKEKWWQEIMSIQMTPDRLLCFCCFPVLFHFYSAFYFIRRLNDHFDALKRTAFSYQTCQNLLSPVIPLKWPLWWILLLIHTTTWLYLLYLAVHLQTLQDQKNNDH